MHELYYLAIDDATVCRLVQVTVFTLGNECFNTKHVHFRIDVS